MGEVFFLEESLLKTDDLLNVKKFYEDKVMLLGSQKKSIQIKICLIFLFSLTSSFANDRDVRLNQLFNELKVNKAKVAAIVEQEIWSFMEYSSN